MITANTITDAQIRALRDEPNTTQERAALCATALDGHEANARDRRSARARCAAILNTRSTAADEIIDEVLATPDPIDEERIALRERVAAVLNDRRGFHVDELDEETREDLLDAIIEAVQGSAS